MDDVRRSILELAASNAVVVPEQVAHRLKVEMAEVVELLGTLVDAGLLVLERWFAGAPACYRITQAGLDAVGSGLPGWSVF
jgi:hypothetical protein